MVTISNNTRCWIFNIVLIRSFRSLSSSVHVLISDRTFPKKIFDQIHKTWAKFGETPLVRTLRHLTTTNDCCWYRAWGGGDQNFFFFNLYTKKECLIPLFKLLPMFITKTLTFGTKMFSITTKLALCHWTPWRQTSTQHDCYCVYFGIIFIICDYLKIAHRLISHYRLIKK